MSTLSTLLSALSTGDVEVVDLTAPLSPDTPVLQLPTPFANTIPLSLEPVSDFDDAGPAWAWNDIHTGEHTGTHLDAPVHWISGRDGLSVDRIAPSRLIGPVAVVDGTAQAQADPDFLLEPEHLQAWEAEHGPFPAGGWVFFRTGWSARSSSQEEFLNADESGPHTPGISAAGARWLAENTAVSGYGVETVGIDAGAAGGFDPAFPAHYFLLGADKYGLTQLQNLHRLPVTGAVVVVAPLPVVGGTGSPARVLALVERS
ncbi:cyclase family protein [Kineococcus esterisolvens]|uniref:cyclase family protein n=1 Tax=unclassified Kineococcus TaxID=2621656 RepID=UPI003D7CCDF1